MNPSPNGGPSRGRLVAVNQQNRNVRRALEDLTDFIRFTDHGTDNEIQPELDDSSDSSSQGSTSPEESVVDSDEDGSDDDTWPPEKYNGCPFQDSPLHEGIYSGLDTNNWFEEDYYRPPEPEPQQDSSDSEDSSDDDDDSSSSSSDDNSSSSSNSSSNSNSSSSEDELDEQYGALAKFNKITYMEGDQLRSSDYPVPNRYDETVEMPGTSEDSRLDPQKMSYVHVHVEGPKPKRRRRVRRRAVKKPSDFKIYVDIPVDEVDLITSPNIQVRLDDADDMDNFSFGSGSTTSSDSDFQLTPETREALEEFDEFTAHLCLEDKPYEKPSEPAPTVNIPFIYPRDDESTVGIMSSDEDDLDSD